MAESNPMRWVVLALVGAGLFAAGIVTAVNHAVDTAKAKAKAEAAAQLGPAAGQGPGASLTDAVSAVAAPFVGHVGAGRFAEAHALLAAPYRAAVSVEAFTRACLASPILVGARSVAIQQVRQQRVAAAATLEARGVLDSAAGAVPVAFVFLTEAGRPRILSVSLAGVPVLQGVVASPGSPGHP